MSTDEQQSGGLKKYIPIKITAENQLLFGIGGAVLGAGLLAGVLIYVFSEPERPPSVRAAGIERGGVAPTAGAEATEAYKEAKNQINSEDYERAKVTPGGVSIPFTFEGEPDAKDNGGVLDDANISDQELLAAIRRLGIDTSSASRDFTQLGNSDLWVRSTGQLVTEGGASVLVDGVVVYVGPKGEIVDAKSNALVDGRGSPLIVAPTGTIVDDQSLPVEMAGRMKNEQGVVYLGNGQLVTTGSNMRQVAETDLYLTGEGQLVTIDGRAVLSRGMRTFVDVESRLVLEDGELLTWEGSAVYMSPAGTLVDGRDRAFSNDGVLLSYDNTLITNRGRLTQPIAQFDRLGDSDLAVNEDGLVVDLRGKPVTHYGYTVFRSTNDRLFLADGRQVMSRSGAPVSLTSRGNFTTPMGSGVFQTGGIVDSEGVAYTRRGMLVSQRGALKRRGDSDIYLAGDGFLAAASGHAIVHESRDVYLREGSTTDDGRDVLETVDGNAVLAGEAGVVMLSLTGELVTQDGQQIENSVVLRTLDGILVAGDGRLAVDPRGIDPVLGPDGREAFIGQRAVFRAETGELVDEFGAPFYSDDGEAIYLDSTGHLSNAQAQRIAATPMVTMSGDAMDGPYMVKESTRTVQMGGGDIYLTRDGALVDESGRGFFYEDEAVRVDREDGRLLTASGEDVEDMRGQDVYLSDAGTLVDNRGMPITAEVLGDIDGALLGVNGRFLQGMTDRLGESDIYVSGTGLLVDDMGRGLQFNDRPVRREEGGGRLADLTGRPVVDVDSRPVYVDRDGEILRTGGERAKSSLLQRADGVLIDARGRALDRGGLLINVTSSRIYKTDADELVSKSARPIRIEGERAFLGEDNAIVDGMGRALRVNGYHAFMLDDGSLIDSKGEPIRNRSEVDLMITGIGITDVNGLLQGEVESIYQTGRGDGQQLIAATPEETPEEASPQPVRADGPVPAKAAPEPIKLTPAQERRLVRRYEAIMSGMEGQFAQVMSASSAKVAPGVVSVARSNRLGGGSGDAGGAGEAGDGTTQVSEGANRVESYDVLKPAGDALYAVLTTSLNTDFSDRVIAKVVGLHPRDKLYDAKLVGRLELRYEQMVITFKSVVLKDGRVGNIDGLALNPETVEAGLGTDVDRHIMYRYGGLLVGSLIEGAAIAAGETVETREVSTIGGSRFETDGLSGAELALRSLEPVGARIADAFKDNLGRPVTVKMPVGSELGVVLFEPIRVRKLELASTE